jgi:hypothetical protein
MGKQKTAHRAGALIDDAKKWKSIAWKYIRRQVRRLQVRIAKAVKENRWNKVKSLQYLISRSFYAKLLAVKRVTSNKGKKTPGIGRSVERRPSQMAGCSQPAQTWLQTSTVEEDLYPKEERQETTPLNSNNV